MNDVKDIKGTFCPHVSKCPHKIECFFGLELRKKEPAKGGEE